VKPRPSRTNEDIRAARALKRIRHGRNPWGAFIAFRMAELYRYFNKRFGAAPLPDDDDGRDSIKLVFQVLSTTNDAARRMYSVAGTWAPWLPADDLAALVDDVVAHPRRFKADTIAERLGITNEIRIKLDLRTIGAVDRPAKQRKADREERARLAKEQKRRAADIPSLAEVRAARQKKQPWQAAGISRSTWYRRRPQAAA
jgi:hypothetical protein